MDAEPDVIFNGSIPGDDFGISVGHMGDINNDGYDDVAVGADLNNTNGPNSGALYIYFGGQNMDSIPDITIYGNPEDYLSSGMTAGDLNSDGHEDVFVAVVINYSIFDGGVRVYYLESGVYNSSMNVGSNQIWAEDGYFNGTMSTSDIAKELNDRIKNATVVFKDSYGNSFVEIPINISAEKDGNLVLSNLSIVYSYKTPTLEFSDPLNDYIVTHKNEKDSNGNIIVPIKVVSSTPGRLKLVDLRLVLDEAPLLTEDIPDLMMNEDTLVSDLVDLQKYFKDDFDLSSQLTYNISSVTNDTILNVGIVGNRYLSVDALTGPQNDNWTGTLVVTVKCSDRWNSTTISNQFRLTIQNVPDPPAFISTPIINATAGIEYSCQLLAVDGDRDPLTYALAEKPANMMIDPRNGLVVWIPPGGGDYLVSAMVSDGRFNEFQNFSINVPNQAPKINSTPNGTAIKGVLYQYKVDAFDPDGDALIFSLITEISGMTIDAKKGNLSWTPDSTGDFTVKIMIADGKKGEIVQEFLIHVYEKVEPTVDFVTLPEKAKVEGNVAVSGRIIKGTMEVVRIQYRLDSGEWVNLTGNETWQVDLDTTKLRNGNHTLQIRVYDGQTYSEVATRSFTVNNPVTEVAKPFPFLLVGLIISLVVVAVVLFSWRGKKPPDEEE